MSPSKGIYKISSEEFNVLFKTFFAPLCLFANKYLSDMEISKDVVQEVFVKIWKGNIQFKDELAVKAYLYSSVKNKSSDYFKSKHYRLKSDIKIEKLEKIESSSFFFREVMISETFELVANALEKLPLRSREVTKLSALGLSNQQIAEELEISVNTVKTQKRIAYQRLRLLLTRDHFLFISLMFLTVG